VELGTLPPPRRHAGLARLVTCVAPISAPRHVPVLRNPSRQPQARLVKQAAQIVRQGGLIALPTDSSYALACQLDDKAAVERLRRLRGSTSTT
jgi:hydrogenase maturation factor HypF (carbamoyltransferase family)